MKGMILDNISADLYQQWMPGVVAHKECRGAKRPQMREGLLYKAALQSTKSKSNFGSKDLSFFSPKITVAFVVSA